VTGGIKRPAGFAKEGIDLPVSIIRVPWLIPRWARAQVWGRVILLRRGVEISEQLLAHELAHVMQWRALGIFPFMFHYLMGLFRYGYQRHPLELEAQAAARQHDFLDWARDILAAGKTRLPD